MITEYDPKYDGIDWAAVQADEKKIRDDGRLKEWLRLTDRAAEVDWLLDHGYYALAEKWRREYIT